MSAYPEQMRVGHADREKCTERLAANIATGHLTQAEFEKRRDKALEAVTRADLDRLTCDLPDDRPPALTYRTQVAGNGVPFSPRRWFASIVLSMAMIVLPGPIWAAAVHGFNHAPLNGAVPIFIIFAGCVLLIVTGIGFMPDSYETAPRNGTPGERNWLCPCSSAGCATKQQIPACARRTTKPKPKGPCFSAVNRTGKNTGGCFSSEERNRVYGTPKPRQEIRGGLPVLGLQALASYVESGLAQPGEHMHEEIALQLARRLNREGDGKT